MTSSSHGETKTARPPKEHQRVHTVPTLVLFKLRVFRGLRMSFTRGSSGYNEFAHYKPVKSFGTIEWGALITTPQVFHSGTSSALELSWDLASLSQGETRTASPPIEHVQMSYIEHSRESLTCSSHHLRLELSDHPLSLNGQLFLLS